MTVGLGLRPRRTRRRFGGRAREPIESRWMLIRESGPDCTLHVSVAILVATVGVPLGQAQFRPTLRGGRTAGDARGRITSC